MFASRGAALRWIALSLLAVGAGACAEIIGLQPFGGDSGGATASSSTSRGSGGTASAGGGGSPAGGAGANGDGGTSSSTSASGAGGACAGVCASTPNGFSAPVGVLVGTVAPTCPAGWTMTGMTLTANPDFASTCICSCDRPHDECALDYQSCTDPCNGMNGICTGQKILDEPCYATAVGAPMSVTITSVTSATGSCDPSGPPTPPAVSWGSSAVRCTPPEGGACSGGATCVPPSTGVGVCVYASGDVTCPMDYPNQSSYLEGAMPQCDGPCACGPVTGAICDPATSVSFFADSQCTSLLASPSPVDGKCTTLTLNPSSAIKGASFVPTSAGICASVSPTASLTPGDAVTVCCQ